MAKGLYEKWLKPHNLTLLQGWRRDGLTYDQIAANIGINQATLHAWRKKYSEIDKALKKGSEICVYELENALYKASVGYDVEEIERIEQKVVDDKGNVIDGRIKVTMSKRRRHIPPNPTLLIFSLKNRRSDWWKDKPEPTISDDIGNDGFIEALKGTAAEDWSDGDSEIK